MIELNPVESRVLGVLIEKERTTPDQYPLTINAIVNGANQKNNRDPVTALDDGTVLSALISLRNKGLVVQQDGPGQRAPRFRHKVLETAGVNVAEMVVLAELLLRGPQTLGELRGRASRMHSLDSLDMVRNVMEQLMNKPGGAMVKEIPPVPGSRADRWVQLLCPDLHPLDQPAESAPVESAQATPGTPNLAQRVGKLEAEIATLRAALSKLAAAVGESDPLAS